MHHGHTERSDTFLGELKGLIKYHKNPPVMTLHICRFEGIYLCLQSLIAP